LSPDRFTVDTHLFRELGELLVGRDSTALTELIKNAYDADATSVTVHAEKLDDPRHGHIVVRDNGVGMDREQFRTGFLRIASRSKEQGTRKSSRFGRRFTGAKGIGRLAAHKLAVLLEVESVANDPKTGKRLGGFRATIDWKRVEEAETVDEIGSDAVVIRDLKAAEDAPLGTSLTLRRLRRAWTSREIEEFVTQAQAMRPPAFLMDQDWVNRAVGERLLLDAVKPYSSPEQRSGWDLQLTGMLSIGDSYMHTAAGAASWLLEVESTQKALRAALAPTLAYAPVIGSPGASSVRLRAPQLPDSVEPPEFQARILIREGDWNTHADSSKAWRKLASGIRVYQEGFRVLPYGDPGDDWLSQDRLYSKRGRGGVFEVSSLFEEDDADSYLSRLPNRGYLGAVFLTLSGAPSLRMLVNREGFLPEAAFHFVEESLTSAIDYSTRQRTAAKAEKRRQWREDRRPKPQAERVAALPIASARLAETISSIAQLTKEARAAIASGDPAEAKKPLAALARQLEVAEVESGESREDESMLHVLASLGGQTAAFVHETQGLLGAAESMERTIAVLLKETDSFSRTAKSRLQALATTVREVRETLERHASYLTDVGAASARKRRGSQLFADRFNAALRLFAPIAERLSISVENRIATDLKSPPMFPAELVAVFSNLLSNAIKAAGENGQIRASSRETRDAKLIRIENTGTRVIPAKGEQWFKPFASGSTDIDAGLGKGMGLGLTITRRMLQEYGASIHFSDPSSGFATCVELRFSSR
jgi:signal transduction histidine kinase